MTTEAQEPTASEEALANRVSQLEGQIEQLQQTLATRTKNLWIGIGVSFVVFGGLLIIHWAGHFARTTS